MHELSRYFTSAEVAGLPGELISIIEAGMASTPRTLQIELGPSSLGTGCLRCLAHDIAGSPGRGSAGAWLPTIGTAVHEWLEWLFINHEIARAELGLPPRFVPEQRVHVGAYAGREVYGTSDLFEIASGTVVDWKIVGKATLDEVYKVGAKKTYTGQGHLYGLGYENAGFQVRNVLIFFLPRNHPKVRAAIPAIFPYERDVALELLARAERLALDIDRRGIHAVLSELPTHTRAEFSCERYPDFQHRTSPALTFETSTPT